MYTTIEPRLIALLNNDPSSNPYSSPPSLDLPPLHDPNILKASGRPLLLEPDTLHHNGKITPNSSLSSLLIQTEDEDGLLLGGGTKQKPHKSNGDRALGNSSPQSLRKILDDVHDNGAIPSKKRPMPENSKDEFVQLPQPPKKHKAAKQVVPPIIIGLFEPPPQAALFPPMNSFQDNHDRSGLNTVPIKLRDLNGSLSNGTFGEDLVEKDIVAPVVDTKKKKDARPRRKWTEEETNNLLLGVHKHGVGNWTDILDDTNFKFSQRSGADLKDRFRTCCPAELRGKKTASASRLKVVKSTSSLMSENILIDTNEGTDVPGVDEEKPAKSRAHRRKLEDLAQLGIEGPFRKSSRRERRPFTEDEDREILLGYNLHGPAWTRIQRDTRFHLESRQPTDLRDRFRNKYPEKFRAESKEKEAPQASVNSSQSSIDTASYPHISKNDSKAPEKKQTSMSLQLQDVDTRSKESLNFYPPSSIHPSSSREGLRIQEMITAESPPSKSNTLQPQSSLYNNFTYHDHSNLESDAMPFSQSFDWNNTITAPFSGTIGEMDISRLLLDESWPEIPSITKESKQQSFTNINSILSNTNESSGGGNENAFYSLLEDAEVVGASFSFKSDV